MKNPFVFTLSIIVLVCFIGGAAEWLAQPNVGAQAAAHLALIQPVNVPGAGISLAEAPAVAQIAVVAVIVLFGVLACITTEREVY